MCAKALRALAVLCALVACAAPAAGGEPSAILVARPELRHPVFGAAVLLASPIGEDQHMGFILNRPVDIPLARLFPEAAHPLRLQGPLLFGGPAFSSTLFGLVRARQPPSAGSFQMVPGLFAVMNRETLLRIVESEPQNARFFAGVVMWRPGELRRELERGLWYVLPPEAELAWREPQGLWEELVARSRMAPRLRPTSAAQPIGWRPAPGR